VEFDVILNDDGRAAAAIVVGPLQGDRRNETVYDPRVLGELRPEGTSGSSRTTNGWHFKLRRRAGWFASPTVKVQGADTAGNSIIQEDI
jgi:hypothetical protein